MTAADKIQAARALVEPLTGYTPGVWFMGADFEDGPFVAGGGYCRANMVGPVSDRLPNSRLMAAAPALRDTVPVLADGWEAEKARADALAQENERLRAIVAKMDAVTPRADKTCDQPGITLSEAVQRQWPELRIGETP